ncbi:Mycinamicin III 3''-O-methyltransferase [Lacunisphaera limnophila]|uniref:Mycinamicin III 3''-O-methyltransferase n=1 Tax=Lacunisphaera limnophila TaxID=1838286 RepID=A0A1D8ARW0_9BACT|nr:TylF/MycF/NovP-related O-methyltransferase [Lacunisphaera limnophila]AOS43616.1 Mycinamicin III 3''-O-methyltransferase [Lacunisphaera limnophila]
MTNSRWEILLDGLVKRALFWSPLRSYLLYKYRYAFTPGQLARLTLLATEAAAADGDFCEIGCYRGYTTVFLNRHLDAIAPAKRYWAIDTFGGFVAADVTHEQAVRGKSGREERRALDKFTVNSRAWFEANLRANGITRVRTHAAAVQDFDFPADTRLCFALLDVDLYLPTVAGLAKLWPRLAPGGLVVVDDCQADHVYDGSRQAVEEFCAQHGIGYELVETKLAVLRKPRG